MSDSVDSMKWYIEHNKKKKKKINKFDNQKKSPIKCGVIIFNNELNKIVLIQNKYLYLDGQNKYGLPKGHINKNESYANCAKREAFEETGLILKLNNTMPKIKINNTYYFPLILDIERKLSPIDKNEIQDAYWILIDNIKNLTLNRETKIFLNKKLKEVKDLLINEKIKQ